jgi:hypothetical protein
VVSPSGFFELPAAWFTVPAMVGTLIFLFKFAMMMLGGHGHDVDGGVGHHGGGDSTHGDAHGDDSGNASKGFKLLSVQAFSAALMGFGWAGYASQIGSDRGLLFHMVVGVAAGIFSGVLLAWLLRQLTKMNSDGTLKRDALLGAEGVVYIAVPMRGAGKTGQVRVVVNSRERFLPAVCESGEIPTKGKVMIVGTNADNSVTVMPIDAVS